VTGYNNTQPGAMTLRGKNPLTFNDKRILATGSTYYEDGSTIVSPSLDLVSVSKTKQTVPSDTVPSVCTATEVPPFWWELGIRTLMANAVVSKRHPSLTECLQGKAGTIVLNQKWVTDPFRDDNIDTCRSGIPSIRDEFGESDVRRIGNRPERSEQVVLFE